MSSKQPLNFAQALRMKPRAAVDAEQEEVVDQSTSLVNQSTTVVDQSTSLVDQSTTPLLLSALVDQSTSQPVNQSMERFFPSRCERRMKGIRLPIDKLEIYEDWQYKNKKVFKDFQDMVEYALDWLTGQPVDQLTNLPVNQSTTLINSKVNNQVIINDEKTKRIAAQYMELTGRNFNRKDLEAYGEVAQLEESVIVRGMQVAIQRGQAAGRTINGFRYALQCIKDVAKITTSVSAELDKTDYGACPDCHGTGFHYVDELDRGKGVEKCMHPKLKP